MAAGMGSRFGGLKQVEPVGPNGEFILDYSIYDAIKAGYKKVVFIIKEENFAECLERVLYKCPHCGTEGEITTTKNNIKCNKWCKETSS